MRGTLPATISRAFPGTGTFDLHSGRNGSVLRVRHSPCNWLQVNENETDPIHLSFLHTRLFGVQFEPVYAEIPTMEWMETPTGMVYITVRRWGEYLYLRTNDMLLPNAVRVAGINDGEGETLFDRRGSTLSWVVPVDDTRCFSIGWSDIDKELAIPGGTGYVDRRSGRGAYVVGAGDVGQTGAPAYEERQRAPGDWDAWVSQGPVTSRPVLTLSYPPRSGNDSKSLFTSIRPGRGAVHEHHSRP